MNFKHQILIVTEEGVDGIAKIGFSEFTLAKASDPVRLTDKQYTIAQLDRRNWRYFFRISINNRQEKMIICASQSDRDQWLRVFHLILRMNSLHISQS